jgi:two-component system response regulator FlrC
VDSRHTRRQLERDARLAAQGSANVLITSECGVAKAGVARYIHEHSDRASKGFAAINCAGVPDRVIEAALFGRVQGSFATVYRDKPGLIESVPGGTMFLDNVDALSMRMQERLLRFLESGEYLRIGGGPVQIQPWLGVRLIASATTDLAARVASGLFLRNLYIRLSVHRLPVPASPAGAPAWRHL